VNYNCAQYLCCKVFVTELTVFFFYIVVRITVDVTCGVRFKEK
jgi:hypothetical protein